MPLGNHKQLIVWQKSMNLVEEVYRLTETFPKNEMYGLTSQMRRAAVSIPCNIAEGRRRISAKEFTHFIRIAFGSASELETQIEIGERLQMGQKEKYTTAKSLLAEVIRMLNKMSSP